MVRIASNGRIGYKYNIHTLNSTLLLLYGIVMNKYTPDQVKVELNGYTKFLVVRNPFNRLVSAYYSKIIEGNDNIHQIFIKYLQDIRSDEQYKRKPNLRSFLEMIVSNHKAATDAHWISYFNTSNPCFIQYEYILRLETLQEDLSNFLFKSYSGIKYKKYMNLHKNPSKNQVIMHNQVIPAELTSLNKTMINMFVKKYKYDFTFFGYSYKLNSPVIACKVGTKLYHT